MNPCESPNVCGRNAECLASGHQATCRCPAKTRGDALRECVPIECIDNNDCSHQETCLDSHCVNPCSLTNTCGQYTECTPINHIGLCSCHPGYTGDPHLGCVALQYCGTDNQCPSGTKCSNGICSCKYLETIGF